MYTAFEKKVIFSDFCLQDLNLMVGYFCIHLLDNYVDPSDLYVDMLVNNVDFSDHNVDFSKTFHHNK